MVICFGVFLCLSRGNRTKSTNIIPTALSDELSCCGFILNKTNFVRAFRQLQMNVTLYGCFFVLFLLLISYLESMEYPFLLDFEDFLSIWPSPPVLLTCLIIISVDVVYIVTYLYFRNAIYRKPGDTPLLVLFEVVSFTCRYYFEGELFNIVWLIPFLIYLMRASHTLFDFKQPYPAFLQNNPKSTVSTYNSKCKVYTKDIVKLVDSVPFEPYEGPPPYGTNAPVAEYFSRPPQPSRNDSTLRQNYYLFGEDDNSQPTSFSFNQSNLKFIPSSTPNQDEIDNTKDELIARFSSLNLG